MLKIYNENEQLIDGNWKLCKAIVMDYDKENPFEHTTIRKNTVEKLVKKYKVSYEDIVKSVKLLSGVSL
ncbi:hypothetical protein CMI47_14970 [Candidatus Pacearchaeota archaeon]|jgi:hypothetical protein|nr:hypothetical protein [Candidatus Pacearchaeota archaeon]|tara:strand:+ start:4897 stop:5103 length:207 start_codon:yes stop_codon:yes gene_type:complete